MSRVDAVENALRERLAPGRYRPGDRLPPEPELARTLGVSRGTLRLALERLESNGEVIRRQGSGTFVGRVAMPAAFSEGLEVLRPYSALAALQGSSLSAADTRIERVRAPGYVVEALDLKRGARVRLIQRTLLADGRPAAYMRDTLHPKLDIPSSELKDGLRSGRMVLDLLLERHVAVAFARTQIRPRLVEPDSVAGLALRATRITAALETVETLHAVKGPAIQHSVNVFVPGAIDLHVIRALEREDSDLDPTRQQREGR